MKIAEIAPPWISIPPAGYGGIELMVDVLARGLGARGHDVTLVAPAGSHSDAAVMSPLPAPGIHAIGDAWIEAYHVLSAYLRAAEFDIIHDHTLLGPALATVSDGGTPVVHTLHGPWNERSRAYYELIHQRAHLVAISETQRRAHPELRYAATVPNGIDVDRYPLNTGDREDFLVYIGRSNSEKAPELAVELAHRAGLPIKLVVKRAEPAERRHWEREVEPLLDGSEDLIDAVGHDEKVELLQRGRAFVFPIRWEEPFGLAMVEAMACGMPVVATPRGAASDLVVDGVTGFLREDLDELAAALEDVDSLSPEACREHVVAHFASARMIEDYEQLFTALCG